MLENFGRFSGETNYHPPALWFYLPVLSYGLAPWVVFLPPALTTALEHEGKQRLPDGQTAPWNAGFCLFYRCRFCIHVSRENTAFLLYSAGIRRNGRAHRHNMRPLDPGAFHWRRHLFMAQVRHRPPFLPCLDWLAPQAALQQLASPAESAAISTIAVAGLLAFSVGLVAQYAMLKAHRVELSLVTLAVSCAIAMTLLAPVAFDFSFRKMNLDLQTIATRLCGTSTQVVVYKSFNPSLMFYLRRPIDFLFEPKLLEKAGAGPVKKPRHLFVITRDKDSQELLSLYSDNMRLVDAQGHWRVFETTGLSAYKQQPLWMLYQYCFERLVKGKDKYGPMVVPYSAGLPRIRHLRPMQATPPH